TSGANDFFYLSRAEAERRGLPLSLLAPLLRSPRLIDRIRLVAERLPALALVCPGPLADLDPATRAYIAEHAPLAARPSFASRPRWWSLPARPARLFLTKAY